MRSERILAETFWWKKNNFDERNIILEKLFDKQIFGAAFFDSAFVNLFSTFAHFRLNFKLN